MHKEEKISMAQLSFGHKALIFSVSKLITKSKASFTKVVHYGMLFENVSQTVKVKLAFVHKAVILSQTYQRLIQEFLTPILVILLRLRLKLNTKITLNGPPTHPPPTNHKLF